MNIHIFLTFLANIHIFLTFFEKAHLKLNILLNFSYIPELTIQAHFGLLAKFLCWNRRHFVNTERYLVHHERLGKGI